MEWHITNDHYCRLTFLFKDWEVFKAEDSSASCQNLSVLRSRGKFISWISNCLSELLFHQTADAKILAWNRVTLSDMAWLVQTYPTLLIPQFYLYLIVYSSPWSLRIHITRLSQLILSRLPHRATFWTSTAPLRIPLWVAFLVVLHLKLTAISSS